MQENNRMRESRHARMKHDKFEELVHIGEGIFDIDEDISDMGKSGGTSEDSENTENKHDHEHEQVSETKEISETNEDEEKVTIHYYCKMHPCSACLSDADKIDAEGVIFRIFNKNNGRSFISYAKRPKPIIRKIFRHLNSNTYTQNAQMQQEYNANPSAFAAEDLQYYYAGDNIKVLLSNWRKYYAGRNEALLYNMKANRIFQDDIEQFEEKDSEAYRIKEENTILKQKLEYIKSINEKQRELIDSYDSGDNSTCSPVKDSLKNESEFKDNISENIDKIILSRIEDEPLIMLKTLTYWMNTNLHVCRSLESCKDIGFDSLEQIVSNISSSLNSINDTDSATSASNVSNFKEDDNEDNKKTDTPAAENIPDSEDQEVVEYKLREHEKTMGKKCRSLPKESASGFVYLQWHKNFESFLYYASDIIDDNKFLDELYDEAMIFYDTSKYLKSRDVANLYTKNMPIEEICSKLNISKKNIYGLMDSMQKTFPALYLAFGFGPLTSTGKQKRVISVLKDKGVTNIPSVLTPAC